jgi:hypothetical protein
VVSRIGICATTGVELIEGNSVTGADAGVVIGGGSPQVVDNAIADSKVAITVGGDSRPELRGNRLCGTNVKGVVVAGSAEPLIDTSNDICDADAG